MLNKGLDLVLRHSIEIVLLNYQSINHSVKHSAEELLLLNFKVIKVAEHSFQEPMPNSALLLSYLCFGALFLQESGLTTEEFILAFWLRCVLLPWQWG